METNPDVITPKPRLNPFAFPSETTLRFMVLVVALLGATLAICSGIIFFSLQPQGKIEEILKQVSECTSNLEPWGSVFQKAGQAIGNPTNVTSPAMQAWNQCQALLYQEFSKSGWFAISVSGVLLCLTSVIYSLFPFFLIHWRGMVSLTQQPDMEEVVADLKSLCLEMGIVHPPKFLLQPRSKAIGGQAFGSLGQYYLVLPVGLITLFDTDQEAFRAVMLHELSHLRNTDVDKTYLSIIASSIFFIAILIAVGFTWSAGNFSFQIGGRILALGLLVYLALTAVVRSRESYADVRASVYLRSDSLSRLLDSSRQRKHMGWQHRIISFLEYLPYFKQNHWHSAFQFHPDPVERRKALEKTDRLFYFDSWVAFATGTAISAAFYSIKIVLVSYVITTPGMITPGQKNLALLQDWIPFFIFIPFIIGIVGLGIWREVFVSLIHNARVVKAGKLGIVLGVGLIFGHILSPYSSMEAQPWYQNPIATTWYLFWIVLFLVVCYYFFKWIATTASVWLSIAVYSRSPYPFYTVGLIITGIVSALLFRVMNTVLTFIQPLTPTSLGELFLKLIFTLFSLVTSTIQEPITLTAFILLWVLPLGAWFWKDRLAGSISISKWVFLEQSDHDLKINIQKQLQLRRVFLSGLKGGLVYCVLLIAIIILQHFIFPVAARQTGTFKVLNFYLADFGLAILIQAIIATKIFKKIKVLGVAYSLLAAFVAGCVMTISDLAINLLFGGKISFLFVWIVFTHIVNLGAFLALLSMMVISIPKHLHSLFTRSNLQKA